MLKHLSFCLLALLINGSINAQSGEYSRVKIFLQGHQVNELSKLGIDITEGDYKQGFSFTSDFSTHEIALIKQAGFATEVIIKDVKQFYKDQNKKAATQKTAQVNLAGCGGNAPIYNTPINFTLGSMGGYFYYAEMLNELDNMATLFPNLITVKQPIGATTTIEGRPVYYVKISDNPTVDETEPEVLYTAVHHAREPAGMSQLIFYMYYLLEQYAANTDIQALVDNTEMYFVLCVNPDGYIENETTDPAGGGLWRKNKRDNLDGSFGVDLNRNYAYNWGFDDTGSSPTTSANTYRGTNGFSEPETQLLRDFANAHQFKLAFNYHTYSNLVIYPWGYQANIYTPDSLLYNNYGQLLTTYNGYRFGTGNQTVNYVTNGSSDDWMYGEQTVKAKIFAMTPEVGEVQYGFWPPSSEITRLCKENVFSNLTLARLAGKYATTHDESPMFLSSSTGYLQFNFIALGLDTSGSFTVSVVPVNAAIATTGTPKVFTNFSPLQSITDSISYNLNGTTSIGGEIQYVLAINNGIYTIYSDTLTKYYGASSILVSDAGTNLNNWLGGTQWGVDNSYAYSAPSSISDSPFGASISGTTNVLTLSTQVSLSNALHAALTFYTRWEIQNIYDYTQLLISTNNGITWTPLCGKYTHPSANSFVQNEPVYDGFRTEWVREEINLDAYLGQSILLKFESTTDGFAEYDGFFFDDFEISKIITVGLNDLSGNTNFISDPMPNPAAKFTTIQYAINSEPSSTILEVMDPLSRKIVTQALTSSSGKITLDVSKWAAGVYFYHLVNKNSYGEFHRIVVQ